MYTPRRGWPKVSANSECATTLIVHNHHRLCICIILCHSWLSSLLYSASDSSCQSGIQATLGSHDLHAIANALAPVAHKWMLVGTCLDVNQPDLKEIEGRQHILAKQSLLEVISRWLDTNHSVCWNDILKALREPLLDEQRLAKEIEEHVLSQKSLCLMKNYCKY